MRRDEDARDLPKCLFCSQPNEGQRYTFWGGYHVSTTRKRAFLSSTTFITSNYRDMKKVGVFACRRCAKRIVLRASLSTIILFGVCAIGCGIVSGVSFPASALTGWLFVGMTVLFALVSLSNLALSLAPNLDSWTSDALICKKATPLLDKKRKGDAFFTEREYDKLFPVKPKERPETAEEILEAAGIAKEAVRPRGRAGSEEISGLICCPGCSKMTPSKTGRCKWCGENLP
jgi:hypothetical protein